MGAINCRSAAGLFLVFLFLAQGTVGWIRFRYPYSRRVFLQQTSLERLQNCALKPDEECGICGEGPGELTTSSIAEGNYMTPVLTHDNVIDVQVAFRADLLGTFQFRLCNVGPDDVSSGRLCNSLPPLALSDNSHNYSPAARQTSATIPLKLPEVTGCDQCVLQVKYRPSKDPDALGNHTYYDCAPIKFPVGRPLSTLVTDVTDTSRRTGLANTVAGNNMADISSTGSRESNIRVTNVDNSVRTDQRTVISSNIVTDTRSQQEMGSNGIVSNIGNVETSIRPDQGSFIFGNNVAGSESIQGTGSNVRIASLDNMDNSFPPDHTMSISRTHTAQTASIRGSSLDPRMASTLEGTSFRGTGIGPSVTATFEDSSMRGSSINPRASLVLIGQTGGGENVARLVVDEGQSRVDGGRLSAGVRDTHTARAATINGNTDSRGFANSVVVRNNLSSRIGVTTGENRNTASVSSVNTDDGGAALQVDRSMGQQVDWSANTMPDQAATVTFLGGTMMAGSRNNVMAGDTMSAGSLDNQIGDNVMSTVSRNNITSGETMSADTRNNVINGEPLSTGVINNGIDSGTTSTEFGNNLLSGGSRNNVVDNTDATNTFVRTSVDDTLAVDRSFSSLPSGNTLMPSGNTISGNIQTVNTLTVSSQQSGGNNAITGGLFGTAGVNPDSWRRDGTLGTGNAGSAGNTRLVTIATDDRAVGRVPTNNIMDDNTRISNSFIAGSSPGVDDNRMSDVSSGRNVFDRTITADLTRTGVSNTNLQTDTGAVNTERNITNITSSGTTITNSEITRTVSGGVVATKEADTSEVGGRFTDADPNLAVSNAAVSNTISGETIVADGPVGTVAISNMAGDTQPTDFNIDNRLAAGPISNIRQDNTKITNSFIAGGNTNTVVREKTFPAGSVLTGVAGDARAGRIVIQDNRDSTGMNTVDTARVSDVGSVNNMVVENKLVNSLVLSALDHNTLAVGNTIDGDTAGIMSLDHNTLTVGNTIDGDTAGIMSLDHNTLAVGNTIDGDTAGIMSLDHNTLAVGNTIDGDTAGIMSLNTGRQGGVNNANTQIRNIVNTGRQGGVNNVNTQIRDIVNTDGSLVTDAATMPGATFGSDNDRMLGSTLVTDVRDNNVAGQMLQGRENAVPSGTVTVNTGMLSVGDATVAVPVGNTISTNRDESFRTNSMSGTFTTGISGNSLNSETGRFGFQDNNVADRISLETSGMDMRGNSNNFVPTDGLTRDTVSTGRDAFVDENRWRDNSFGGRMVGNVVSSEQGRVVARDNSQSSTILADNADTRTVGETVTTIVRDNTIVGSRVDQGGNLVISDRMLRNDQLATDASSNTFIDGTVVQSDRVNINNVDLDPNVQTGRIGVGSSITRTSAGDTGVSDSTITNVVDRTNSMDNSFVSGSARSDQVNGIADGATFTTDNQFTSGLNQQTLDTGLSSFADINNNGDDVFFNVAVETTRVNVPGNDVLGESQIQANVNTVADRGGEAFVQDSVSSGTMNVDRSGRFDSSTGTNVNQNGVLANNVNDNAMSGATSGIVGGDSTANNIVDDVRTTTVRDRDLSSGSLQRNTVNDRTGGSQTIISGMFASDPLFSNNARLSSSIDSLGSFNRNGVGSVDLTDRRVTHVQRVSNGDSWVGNDLVDRVRSDITDNLFSGARVAPSVGDRSIRGFVGDRMMVGGAIITDVAHGTRFPSTMRGGGFSTDIRTNGVVSGDLTGSGMTGDFSTNTVNIGNTGNTVLREQTITNTFDSNVPAVSTDMMVDNVNVNTADFTNTGRTMDTVNVNTGDFTNTRIVDNVNLNVNTADFTNAARAVDTVNVNTADFTNTGRIVDNVNVNTADFNNAARTDGTVNVNTGDFTNSGGIVDTVNVNTADFTNTGRTVDNVNVNTADVINTGQMVDTVSVDTGDLTNTGHTMDTVNANSADIINIGRPVDTVNVNTADFTNSGRMVETVNVNTADFINTGRTVDTVTVNTGDIINTGRTVGTVNVDVNTADFINTGRTADMVNSNTVDTTGAGSQSYTLNDTFIDSNQTNDIVASNVASGDTIMVDRGTDSRNWVNQNEVWYGLDNDVSTPTAVDYTNNVQNGVNPSYETFQNDSGFRDRNETKIEVGVNTRQQQEIVRVPNSITVFPVNWVAPVTAAPLRPLQPEPRDRVTYPPSPSTQYNIMPERTTPYPRDFQSVTDYPTPATTAIPLQFGDPSTSTPRAATTRGGWDGVMATTDIPLRFGEPATSTYRSIPARAGEVPTAATQNYDFSSLQSTQTPFVYDNRAGADQSRQDWTNKQVSGQQVVALDSGSVIRDSFTDNRVSTSNNVISKSAISISDTAHTGLIEPSISDNRQSTVDFKFPETLGFENVGSGTGVATDARIGNFDATTQPPPGVFDSISTRATETFDIRSQTDVSMTQDTTRSDISNVNTAWESTNNVRDQADIVLTGMNEINNTIVDINSGTGGASAGGVVRSTIIDQSASSQSVANPAIPVPVTTTTTETPIMLNERQNRERQSSSRVSLDQTNTIVVTSKRTNDAATVQGSIDDYTLINSGSANTARTDGSSAPKDVQFMDLGSNVDSFGGVPIDNGQVSEPGSFFILSRTGSDQAANRLADGGSFDVTNTLSSDGSLRDRPRSGFVVYDFTDKQTAGRDVSATGRSGFEVKSTERASSIGSTEQNQAMADIVRNGDSNVNRIRVNIENETTPTIVRTVISQNTPPPIVNTKSVIGTATVDRVGERGAGGAETGVVYDNSPVNTGVVYDINAANTGVVYDNSPVNTGVVYDNNPVNTGIVYDNSPVNTGVVYDNNPVNTDVVYESDPVNTAGVAARDTRVVVTSGSKAPMATTVWSGMGIRGNASRVANLVDSAQTGDVKDPMTYHYFNLMQGGETPSLRLGQDTQFGRMDTSNTLRSTPLLNSVLDVKQNNIRGERLTRNESVMTNSESSNTNRSSSTLWDLNRMNKDTVDTNDVTTNYTVVNKATTRINSDSSTVSNSGSDTASRSEASRINTINSASRTEDSRINTINYQLQPQFVPVYIPETAFTETGIRSLDTIISDQRAPDVMPPIDVNFVPAVTPSTGNFVPAVTQSTGKPDGPGINIRILQTLEELITELRQPDTLTATDQNLPGTWVNDATPMTAADRNTVVNSATVTRDVVQRSSQMRPIVDTGMFYFTDSINKDIPPPIIARDNAAGFNAVGTMKLGNLKGVVEERGLFADSGSASFAVDNSNRRSFDKTATASMNVGNGKGSLFDISGSGSANVNTNEVAQQGGNTVEAGFQQPVILLPNQKGSMYQILMGNFANVSATKREQVPKDTANTNTMTREVPSTLGATRLDQSRRVDTDVLGTSSNSNRVTAGTPTPPPVWPAENAPTSDTAESVLNKIRSQMVIQATDGQIKNPFAGTDIPLHNFTDQLGNIMSMEPQYRSASLDATLDHNSLIGDGQASVGNDQVSIEGKYYIGEMRRNVHGQFEPVPVGADVLSQGNTLEQLTPRQQEAVLLSNTLTSSNAGSADRARPTVYINIPLGAVSDSQRLDSGRVITDNQRVDASRVTSDNQRVDTGNRNFISQNNLLDLIKQQRDVTNINTDTVRVVEEPVRVPVAPVTFPESRLTLTNTLSPYPQVPAPTCRPGERFVCRGVGSYQAVPGMVWWCFSHCKNGFCPPEKCDCNCEQGRPRTTNSAATVFTSRTESQSRDRNRGVNLPSPIAQTRTTTRTESLPSARNTQPRVKKVINLTLNGSEESLIRVGEGFSANSEKILPSRAQNVLSSSSSGSNRLGLNTSVLKRGSTRSVVNGGSARVRTSGRSNAALVCRGINAFEGTAGMDEWCTTMCRKDVCPAEICAC